MNIYTYPTALNGIYQTCEELENSVNTVYINHPEYFSVNGNNVTVTNRDAFATAIGYVYYYYGGEGYYGLNNTPMSSTGICTTTYLTQPLHGMFDNSGSYTLGNYAKRRLLFVHRRSTTNTAEDCVMNIDTYANSSGARVYCKAVGPYKRDHKYDTEVWYGETIILADGKTLKSSNFYCIYDTYFDIPEYTGTARRPAVGFGKRIADPTYDQVVVAVTHTFTLATRAASYSGVTLDNTDYGELTEWSDQSYTINQPSYMLPYSSKYTAGKVGNYSPWPVRAEEVRVNGVKLSPTATLTTNTIGDSTWSLT